MQSCKKCVHYTICKTSGTCFWENKEQVGDDYCRQFLDKENFKEVKHSKWVKVKVDLGEGITTYRAACLHCGFQKNTFIGNYCPNCGAIMDCKNEIKYVDELNGENTSE